MGAPAKTSGFCAFGVSRAALVRQPDRNEAATCGTVRHIPVTFSGTARATDDWMHIDRTTVHSPMWPGAARSI